MVVDNTNTTRSSPMVVYYDYQFGSKTGTNVFGTEMTCKYDFDLNTFVVTSFRNFGMGDDSGSDIPTTVLCSVPTARDSVNCW